MRELNYGFIVLPVAGSLVSRDGPRKDPALRAHES